jgi:hypothetical protein
MGDDFHTWLVWKLHSRLPVLASAAANAPLSSQKNTTSLAVASTPPHESTAPNCGSSHATLPVWMSIARSTRCAGSGAAANVPPMKLFPDSHA